MALSVNQQQQDKALINLSKRRRNILDLLSRHGYVATEEFTTEFNVTPQTLRRDLQELADMGLLRRHHGGASVNSSTANSDYVMRHVENADEKARIGTAVAAMIPSSASAFLTPGTTVEAAAQALADRHPTALHIVTNSTAAAGILDQHDDIRIHLTGGTWLASNRALGGASAAESIERFSCDFAIMSIGAIDAAGNLLEYRHDEVVVARAMLRNARHSILLADHTKFSRVATFKLGQLSQFTTLVTDRIPGGPVAMLIRDAQCNLIVAS